jgi:ABC-type glycerol-3-phosphate transport system substrate-binding protein
MMIYNSSALFASLLCHGFVDTSVIPNTPQLSTPELEALFTAWVELQAEIGMSDFQGDMEQTPLKIEGSWRLWQPTFDTDDTEDPNEPEWAGALLPGGGANLTVQGFAVSGGTAYREQAYALAKFLTTSPEVVTRFFGSTPARQSMVGVETDDTAFFPNIPDEVQALIDEAVANAIPLSELRFSDYVGMAVGKMQDAENPVDALTALQGAEDEALANLETAEEQRTSAAVYVPTPVPTPVLAAGESALDFAFTSFISPMPNRDQLEALIDEFVANDPDVGQIVLDTGFQQNYAEDFDCYYLPYNAVPGADLTTLLNLDPFMSSDPRFDPNDVVGNTMTQVQRDSLIWAYPIIIQPAILWYHTEKFTESGVIEPQSGWTISEFNDALGLLHLTPDDPAPFVPQGFGSTDLLLLVAAYGGLPLDYSTNPPTVDYTSQVNVDAIRQVLDLAKDGYIEYRELAGFGGGFGGGASDIPILTDYLSALNWRLQNLINPEMQGDSEFVDPYRLTTYPVGSQYTPVSYDIGTAYISANAENPAACYRWISILAQHPEVLSAMPARRSLISSTNVTMAQGQNLADVYQEIDDLMRQPNTVIFPSQFNGAGDNTPNAFIVQFWLNRAFDRYVLEDGDLETELAEAQSNAQAYMECAASLPRFDPAQYPTQAEQVEYFQMFGECATTIDPSMEPLFSFGQEEDEG